MAQTIQKPTFLFCFTFVLFGSFSSFAQTGQLRSERLSTENGVSSNFIYTALQDSKGFLWIGTNDGLNRYDGYGFKVFKNINGDSTSLIENTVMALYEDHDGNIWVGTLGGLCRYNYAKNDFSRIDMFANDPAEQAGQIMEVNQDEFMIATNQGVCLLNIHSLRKQMINAPNDILHRVAEYNLAKDNRGKIYLVAGKNKINPATIFVYEENQKLFKPFYPDPVIKSEELEKLFFDSRNGCWLGTANNGLVLHSATGLHDAHFAPIKDNQTIVSCFFEDSQRNIWIGTAKGILFYDDGLQKISYYNYPGTNAFLQDQSGLIWACTDNGLYKINPSLGKFKHLSEKPNSFPRLLNNFVFGFRAAGENKLWVSYYWGVKKFSLIDFSNNTIEHLSTKDLGLTDYLKMLTKNPDKFNASCISDPGNRFGNIRNDNPMPYECLLFDSQQKLWQNFKTQLIFPGNKQSLLSAVNDQNLWNDEIWLATNDDGLFCVDTRERKVSKHFTHSNDKYSINSDDLNCLLIEKDGNMWIGTKGSGLDYFDRQKNIFKHYTTKEGLCNNSVYNLVKDDHDRLWIGTGEGLSCLDPATNTFKNFFRSDGLINSEFNRQSAIKLKNGYIVMGGMNGIDYFHPESVLNDAYKPQVQITDVKVFDKNVFPFSDLSLKHNENYLKIEFAAMDFQDPPINKFAYKLQGINNDWVLAENQRSVSFANLASGRYHFLVKAAGSDGIWNETPAEMYFTILSPWWKTWWFYGGCMALFSCLFFSFYTYRIKQFKKVIRLRTRIAQDLHDDVGATLSGIRVFSQLAKDRPEHNREYVDKISHYSDEMLNKLSDIVWSINAENDRFEHLINKLKAYAQNITQAKNINLSFEVDPAIQKKELNMNLRKNIYMITREAINNTVKYAESKNIWVSLHPKEAGGELMIRDDGKGFDKTRVNGGNGLTNIRKRAEEIQGSLSIDSTPEKGTCIRLLFNFT